MISDTRQLTPENGNAPNGRYYYSDDKPFKLRKDGDTLHIYRQDADHPEQANWLEVGKILHWQDGQLGLSLADDPTQPPSEQIYVTGSLLTRVWGGQDAPLLMPIDNGRKSWISASNLDDWLSLDSDIALDSTGNDHLFGKAGNDTHWSCAA